GVADHAGEIPDQKQDLVTQVLQLLQLVEEHRVAEMQVGRRGIEAGLDPQRAPGAQLLAQLGLDQQLVRAAPDDLDLSFDGFHAVMTGGIGAPYRDAAEIGLRRSAILLSCPLSKKPGKSWKKKTVRF